MNHSEFVDRFESCTLPPEEFHHRDHVRLGWIYLRTLPLLEALDRFSSGLRRFAASLGKDGLYHETITWAYLLLIHERLARTPGDDFEAFCAHNQDLVTWKPSILDSYYRCETLASDRARETFVLPDRLEAR